MSLIQRLLAIIAGFGLAITVWGFIATSQLFSAQKLETTANQAGTYEATARELPALLSQVSPLSSSEQSLVAPYLDSDLVSGWAQTLLPELETYYRDGGATPELDLGSIATSVSAAGIPLPIVLSDRLATPVMVSAGRLDPTIRQGVRLSAVARIAGPIIALLSTALGLLLARGRRFRWLAGAFLWGGVILIIFWGMLAIIPGLVASSIVNSPAGALAVPFQDWIKTIIAGPRKELLYAAAGSGVLAVISFLAQYVVGLRRRKHAE